MVIGWSLMNTTKDETPAVPEPVIGLARTRLEPPTPPPPINPLMRQRGRPLLQESIMRHLHGLGGTINLNSGSTMGLEVAPSFSRDDGEPLPHPDRTGRGRAARRGGAPPPSRGQGAPEDVWPAFRARRLHGNPRLAGHGGGAQHHNRASHWRTARELGILWVTPPAS